MPLNSSLSMSFGGVDDFVDLVELLPSDPFEMNPENAFDPAVNYRVGDAVVEDNSLDGSGCYCNAAFESQIGYRGGCEAENGATSAEVGVPHEGLFYALGKLGVKDLLSVERVCKSLYYAVRNDPLLWRCIHVDLDFNRKIPDDAFFALTQRAQGSLRCLSMPGCVGITDDGLKRVLAANPRLSKVFLKCLFFFYSVLKRIVALLFGYNASSVSCIAMLWNHIERLSYCHSSLLFLGLDCS